MCYTLAYMYIHWSGEFNLVISNSALVNQYSKPHAFATAQYNKRMVDIKKWFDFMLFALVMNMNQNGLYSQL